mmetsp:Transcript_12237/g.34414  ORF Transcript_12237/g.34414 Transcript_12237/m.34414 type:complete len:288 (-) Transcript_12237:418-1281(-)
MMPPHQLQQQTAAAACLRCHPGCCCCGAEGYRGRGRRRRCESSRWRRCCCWRSRRRPAGGVETAAGCPEGCCAGRRRHQHHHCHFRLPAQPGRRSPVACCPSPGRSRAPSRRHSGLRGPAHTPVGCGEGAGSPHQGLAGARHCLCWPAGGCGKGRPLASAAPLRLRLPHRCQASLYLTRSCTRCPGAGIAAAAVAEADGEAFGCYFARAVAAAAADIGAASSPAQVGHHPSQSRRAQAPALAQHSCRLPPPPCYHTHLGRARVPACHLSSSLPRRRRALDSLIWGGQ